MRKSSIGLVLFTATLLGCPGGQLPGTGAGGGGTSGGGGGTSGGERDAQLDQCAQRDWGSAQAALKLEGFLLATSDFLGAAADVQDSMTRTCKKMGRELGVSSAAMSGGVKDVCNPVVEKLRSEMGDIRGKANLNVKVVATPPRCEVDMDAYAECTAKCEAELEPGEVDVQCEGGHIVGQCSAKCTGECNVDVQGTCQGTCEGTCTAQCQGTCKGECEGECSSTGADGQCNGQCDGACHGTCEGGCQGSCEGECWVSGKAECNGECRGGCSVDYEKPRCTGEVKPPKASADCKASCDARLNAKAECEPGKAKVVVDGNVSSNLKSKVDRVKAAIRSGYAGIEATGEKLRRLQRTGQELRRASSRLKGSFQALGAQAIRAGQCVTLAGSALPSALGNVSASLEVQVSMSASVTAG
jgi:hypothetical protein